MEENPQSTPEQNIPQVDQPSVTPVPQKPLTTTQEKENKSRKILIYGLPAIALIAIGIFGFWFYQEKIAKKPAPPTMPTRPTATQTPIIPTPSPTPTPEFTIPADWERYRNTNCDYEISYPANWFLTETASGSECQGGSDILTSYQPPKVQIKDPDFFKGKLKIDMSRFIKTKPINQSLEEWLEDYEKNLETMTTTVSQETINLAGQNAIKQIKSHLDTKSINYYIENENRVYFISAGGDFSEHQATFDQILSTFKFLD